MSLRSADSRLFSKKIRALFATQKAENNENDVENRWKSSGNSVVHVGKATSQEAWALRSFRRKNETLEDLLSLPPSERHRAMARLRSEKVAQEMREERNRDLLRVIC